ncbi:MAG TPA: hypothetical protein DIU07_17215 [Rhodobacteraceae bacterium]|nr:hypothetical protein [Paracoccaceae bacterium]
MLALVRKAPLIVHCTRKGDLDDRQSIPVRRIEDTTIGIIGVGQIGRLFAQKALAFGGRVLVCGPCKRETRRQGPGAEQADLADILARCDVISLHCPLRDATRGLIGRA